MPRTLKWLTAIAAIAIAAGLLVWRHHSPGSPGAAESGATVTRSSTSTVPPAHVATNKAPRWKPDIPDDRSFAEIRPELEQRALAGDAAAARRLGVTLANCNRFVDIPDEKVEDIVVEGAARGFSLRDHGRDVPPEQVVGMWKLGLQQKRRDCKGVSGLSEDDAGKKAFQWIERAAALGDADAEAIYGSLAFADFNARNALVDAEKMRDRKQIADEYLQRSLAQGDALALLRYSQGNLDGFDPEMAYAYLYAYSLTSRASEVVPGLLDRMLSNSAAPLDDAARERARAEGQKLAACCGIAASEGQ